MSRILLVALILMPLPALAHTGDHAGSGLLHFLSEPDHLALMALALVVAVALALKYRSRR
jgi:hydrogenase/urease accessory protein HupE